jgi:hypothetical protein
MLRSGRTELTVPQITLYMSDAAELAQTLTFLARWLSGGSHVLPG